MDRLTLKNYHPTVLVFLLCLIIAVNLGFKVVWETTLEHKNTGLVEELIFIILSYSTVLGALSILNRHLKLEWLLKMLGLMNATGNYQGMIISSYDIDDDPSKPHVQLFCKLQIVQNINAIKIEGEFYKDEDFSERSSSFNSFWEEVKKKPNGDFLITYFYSNRGNTLHPDDKKYGLNNHDGVAVLTYSPLNQTLKGYYFNHQRHSNGEISLALQSKIL